MFNPANVNAKDKGFDDSLLTVQQFVLEAPKDFPMTCSWIHNSIISAIPLYGINDTVSAYCVDFFNEDVKQEAYMIVNITSGEPQILEFHPNGKSPYSDSGQEEYYYGGFENYYVKENDGQLQNLLTNILASKDVVLWDDSASPASTSSVSRSVTDGYHNISGVPDYKWGKGCTPTSLAMSIKYRFGSSVDGQNTLIDRLAKACVTDADGYTLSVDIQPGVLSYLSSKNITPSFCRAYSVLAVSDIPVFGAASNPLPAYQSYINSDVPVIILMEGAKGTSAAYPNGFGEHSVCGTGYYVGSAGQFVIVHTTQCEGDVYVAYSEAALGNFAWFIVY
ncbi:MAG: C39 family peptidase [Lachnospiraceae bacterium]|nr:C39 family peptidase [Lachnospiraceae bacterium]